MLNTMDGMTPTLTITDEVGASILAEALYRQAAVYEQRGDGLSAQLAREMASAADHQRVRMWEARRTGTGTGNTPAVEFPTIPLPRIEP